MKLTFFQTLFIISGMALIAIGLESTAAFIGMFLIFGAFFEDSK